MKPGAPRSRFQAQSEPANDRAQRGVLHSQVSQQLIRPEHSGSAPCFDAVS